MFSSEQYSTYGFLVVDIFVYGFWIRNLSIEKKKPKTDNLTNRHIQTPVFPEPTVFAHWDRIVSLHILLADFPVILAAQLLFVFLCYAKNSLFVSDLFQK